MRMGDENIPTTSLLMKRFLMKACIGNSKSELKRQTESCQCKSSYLWGSKSAVITGRNCQQSYMNYLLWLTFKQYFKDENQPNCASSAIKLFTTPLWRKRIETLCAQLISITEVLKERPVYFYSKCFDFNL